MNKPHEPSHSNFIRQRIEVDLQSKTFSAVRTRFPPEPNGYLHYGHAKSICLNFGLAREYGGACNLRFDDTNPEKEEQEYVDSITEMVSWLVPDFKGPALFASDYFDFMYRCAEYLVTSGNAYVDSETPEQIRQGRGSFTEPGKNSPFRDRAKEENLQLLRDMKAGKFPDGSQALRAKIDMRSPNLNLRDPVLYRIRKVAHHRAGDKWCIYPLYTYAHPIEDAIERVTHSLCTLEFEDQRPFYDWLLDKLAEGGLLERPLPKQIEFARLNLTFTVLSKRRLIELVEKKLVDGWDDPRMPTLAGARRRGYTPEGFQRFAEKIGVSKAHQVIELGELEESMREHLNEVAPRRMAVLDPIKLVIENYPEGQDEYVDVPNHQQKPEMGTRKVPFARELWIWSEDYQEKPEKGFFRLTPGADVRLKYGYIVKCLGMTDGVVRCTYYPDSKSGTPGANNYKVKGTIHWASVKHAHATKVRLYDRLYKVPQPDGPEDLNPNSVQTTTAQLEPGLDKQEGNVQFERHGYFIRDRDGAFNRTVTLRDTWKA